MISRRNLTGILTQNITLNPKTKYFIIQLTSVLSYRREGIFGHDFFNENLGYDVARCSLRYAKLRLIDRLPDLFLAHYVGQSN